MALILSREETEGFGVGGCLTLCQMFFSAQNLPELLFLSQHSCFIFMRLNIRLDVHRRKRQLEERFGLETNKPTFASVTLLRSSTPHHPPAPVLKTCSLLRLLFSFLKQCQDFHSSLCCCLSCSLASEQRMKAIASPQCNLLASL